MDDNDNTTMPDTVILGGQAPKKEAEDDSWGGIANNQEPETKGGAEQNSEPEPWGGVAESQESEPWGGASSEAPEQDDWGGGNELAQSQDDPWGQSHDGDHQTFVPDPEMLAELENEEQVENGHSEKAGKSKKWLLIPAAALMIAVVGVAVFFLASGAMDSKELESKEIASVIPAPIPAPEVIPEPVKPPVETYRGVRNVRLELEPFVVPYDSGAKKTFLYLRVALEIDEKQTYALLEANRPLLRGVIYDTVLKEMERVGDEEALNGSLEKFIAARLKSVFSTMGIQRVSFTSSYSV